MITPAYRIMAHANSGYEALLCLVCNRISWNPNDVKQRYCGACHQCLDDVPADYVQGQVRGVAPTFMLVPAEQEEQRDEPS